MPERNDGAPMPAQTNVRWYKVLSPKGSDALKTLLLADRFTGYWVHWDGRVFPCTRESSCWRCKSGQPNRWSAYIAALDIYQRERIILALTEGAARQLLPYIDKYGTLRGLTIECKRIYVSKNNSKVGVRFTNRQLPEEVIPEHPIADSINRLFGINEEWARMHVARPITNDMDARYDGAAMPRRDGDSVEFLDPREARRQVNQIISESFPTC